MGVAELVGVNVTDPGDLGDTAQHAGDHVPIEATAVKGDEPVKVIVTVCVVGFEEIDELWVQRDVAVVVQFADRNPQPVPARHQHHGVERQSAELANA